MLSAALASQTMVAAGLTDFVTLKRWESSLPLASFPPQSPSRVNYWELRVLGLCISINRCLDDLFTVKRGFVFVSSVQLRSAIVCRSAGRCGATRARILG